MPQRTFPISFPLPPTQHFPYQSPPKPERRPETAMSGSKSKISPTGYKMADTSILTPEEEQWVKDRWGSEHHFLQAYGLNIYKEEDREEGRAITRGLMRQESHSGIAKDRGWFKQYADFQTFVARPEPYGRLEVIGIGKVELPVRRCQQDPTAHGTLHLLAVLHAPDAPFNTICEPILKDLYFLPSHQPPWLGFGAAGELTTWNGYPAAYFERYPFHDLNVLVLSPPPLGPSTRRSVLTAQSREMLPVHWPKWEQNRWRLGDDEEYLKEENDSKDSSLSPCEELMPSTQDGNQEGERFTSWATEDAYVRQASASAEEIYALEEFHGLPGPQSQPMDVTDDRESVPEEQDSGSIQAESLDEPLNDNTGRYLEEHASRSNLVDHHFNSEELEYIRDIWGGAMTCIHSLGLRFYVDEDCMEAKSRVKTFMSQRLARERTFAPSLEEVMGIESQLNLHSNS
ncbi:hypothetical protein B0T16DRAFT_492135 [Cercophora newfieldiana]|uniref:Uncharacterized protein n=1 Tax=Cercophora newfieldiana TaxID=92897 RepID=A0AA39YBE0_9PEZI|nr:hypothetical protein B0T16DRAFT_492135 [Cercophora newfieldiana]